eukprot:m.18247 g.18247  ORF g.18247 m.18247 type:complete len:53 (+) comp6250_c0_seq1:1252-1410(+)
MKPSTGLGNDNTLFLQVFCYEYLLQGKSLIELLLGFLSLSDEIFFRFSSLCL